MPLRMAEYCLRVRRNFRKFPQQILVYLGNVPLTMGNELKGPKLSYCYPDSGYSGLGRRAPACQP
jgi:hypothetical protein